MARRNWKNQQQFGDGLQPDAISKLEGMEDDIQTALAGLPVNAVAITAGGNTAGSPVLVSSGTLMLAGGNNVTLSQAGSTISINANAGGGGAAVNLAASNTTYTSGTVTISGVGGGVTVGSNTGQRIDISVAPVVAQTVQTQNRFNLTLSGNTLGVPAVVSSGSLTLAAGSNMVFSQMGNAVTIIGNDQSVQTQNAVAVSVSGNTSGVPALASSGTVTLIGGNNITLNQAGNAITISGPNTSQSVQTQNLVRQVTISGNTSGALAGVSSGTMTLAGGNNITLSQNGNAITFIGAAAGGNNINIAASNTTFTSGTVVFSASGGALTINSAAQSIGFSVPQTSSLSANGNITIGTTGSTISFSAGGGGGAGGIALAASNATFTTGTVNLVTAGGAITINTGASSIKFSVPATSQITAVGGGITISTNGNTVSFSVVPGGGGGGGIALAASDATYTSGTASISGVGGGVTVNSNTGQRVDISVAAPVAQTVQTQNLHNITLAGNTAGVMAQVSSGTLSLAGGANIVLSQAGNAVTISGSAQSVQTQSIIRQMTISGNTSGALVGISSGTMTLAGGANVVLSQAGNAVTISASNQGISLAGSNTTFNTGLVVLSASGGALTINSGASSIGFSVPQTSQLSGVGAITINTNGSTVSISGGYLPIPAWQNMPRPNLNTTPGLMTSISNRGIYWPEIIPGNLTLNTVGVLIAHPTGATATLQNYSVDFAVYSYVNSTSLGLMQSVRETYLYSTASSASWSSARHLVLTSPGTATAISSLGAGAYVFGLKVSAAASQSMNFALLNNPNPLNSGNPDGYLLPGANSFVTAAASEPMFFGQYSVTSANHPAGINRTDIAGIGSGTTAIHPYLMIRS